MIGVSLLLSFCNICGEWISRGDNQCDWCWYGMRMDPDGWRVELKERGIETERDIGCVPTPYGFMCGNPYRKKGEVEV